MLVLLQDDLVDSCKAGDDVVSELFHPLFFAQPVLQKPTCRAHPAHIIIYYILLCLEFIRIRFTFALLKIHLSIQFVGITNFCRIGRTWLAQIQPCTVVSL